MHYITIEGFEKLSKQELFDMSARHILSTGKKSFVQKLPGEQGSSCIYSGSGCGAAPFIQPVHRGTADGMFDKGSGWYSLAYHNMVSKHELDLVIALQHCHDSSSNGELFMEAWKKRMRNVALEFTLNTKVLE